MTQKKREVSLKDIADELGTSISTVSRSLKNSTEISESMKAKIKTLSRERNYRPNPFAVNLLKNSPRIIRIIVPDIVTHFFASIISGINDTARTNSYSVIISSSNESYDNEKRIIEDFRSIRVEGIIACVSQQTKDFSHYENLYNNNIPLVFYDRVFGNGLIPCVVSDNADSAYMATNHLIENGAKRIAFIGGANHIDIVKERKHGYLQSLRDNNFKIEPKLVVCNHLGYNEGYAATHKLLSLRQPPDAILAMNDSLAFGAMKAIKDLRLSIPDDVSIIGYTDEQHSLYVEPALTAVTHQTYKMGNEVCKLLLNYINGDRSGKKIIIPSILSVRDSSVKKNNI